MKTDVTVALTTHKSEKYISACIKALLAQTIKDIEILIVEDPPFDRTKQVTDSFKDDRIVYLRNQRRLGISESRNRCIRSAAGKYVFFTDGDCVVSENWVEEGLKTFHELDCVGVEGKTFYVSEEYEPTRSDRVIENKKGGHLMTCNIAYKKTVLVNVGGFDEKFSRLGDRDLALRTLRLGKICFNPKMVVYHQKVIWTPKQFVQAGEATRNRVLLYKKHGDKPFLIWRILFPQNLMVMFFPPLTFGSLFRDRYKTKADFALFPFIYIRIVYERLSIWGMCAKERVFLV
jgi:GT2 family glycosyltransferase